jgi:mutator protein MutT
MSRSDQATSPRIEIAVAVVERDGMFLIGLRPPGAKLEGYWEFPGGKVQSGETAEDAARRECWEETGLAVRIVGQHPAVNHDYAHAAVRLHFFACEPIEDRAVPPRFRWVRSEDLTSYPFPPANAALIAQLTARKAG